MHNLCKLYFSSALSNRNGWDSPFPLKAGHLVLAEVQHREAHCQHMCLLPASLALPSNHGAAHLLFKRHCATMQLKRTETLGCWYHRPVSCLALCYLLCSSTGFCQTPLSSSINALIWPRSIKEHDSVVGISWINELSQRTEGSSTTSGPVRWQ